MYSDEQKHRKQVDRVKASLKTKIAAAEELLSEWALAWRGRTELGIYEHMDLKIKLISVLVQDDSSTQISFVRDSVDSLSRSTDEISGSVYGVARRVDELKGHLS